MKDSIDTKITEEKYKNFISHFKIVNQPLTPFFPVEIKKFKIFYCLLILNQSN
jgi:hypothetical protein